MSDASSPQSNNRWRSRPALNKSDDEALKMAGLVQLDNNPASDRQTAPAEAGLLQEEAANQRQEADPEVLNRRKFLRRVSYGVGGAMAAIILTPVVGFIVVPVFAQPQPQWREVGGLNDLKIGETKEVKFADAAPQPWSGVSGQSAAWLRRDGEQEFKAFSIDCTHLGCPVQWLPNPKLFMCPCHGGVFYEDGSVAAGPPPEPLHTYPVRLNNGKVEILTSPIPIT